MGKIYSGRHASYSDQVGVIEGGKVYRARHTSYSDQVGVIENGKVWDAILVTAIRWA